MKAINLNSVEYYPPDHKTRKAYRRLIDLRNQYIYNKITDIEFITAVEKVIFNDISIRDLQYLNDGLKNGSYLTIIKELLKSTRGSSLYRLKSDLLTVYK